MFERSAGPYVDDLVESLMDELLHAKGGVDLAHPREMNGDALQFGFVIHFFR
jgi:hypothetical protein